MSGAGGGARRLTRSSWFMFLAPVAVLCAVSLPHLDQGAFRTDTGWYSALGLQAWRTGSLWTLYAEPGQEYFNKPPLVFWIHGLFLWLWGPSVWVARLPSVIAAAGCVVLTAAVARRLSGPTAGLLAGMVLALTYEFFRRTREISLDMWQLVFMLLALWAIVRGATAARGAGRWFAIGGAGIGLALMCKPLVGLLVLPMAAAWLVLSGRWRMCGWLAVSLVAACAVALPWHVSMHLQHADFAGQYFGAQVGERLAGRVPHANPGSEHWWYYLRIVWEGYWPWAITTVLAVSAWTVGFGGTLKSRRGDLVLAAVWAFGWLVLLSAFADKRPRYMLPVWPAWAWMSAVWICRSHGAGLRRAAWAWAPRVAGAVIVGGAVLAVLPVRVQGPDQPQWPELFAWMREEGVTPGEIWEGAFSGDKAARLYLEFGSWPVQTRDWMDRPIATPPAGALVIFHGEQGAIDDALYERAFSSGDLTVARLRGQEPVKSPEGSESAAEGGANGTPR